MATKAQISPEEYLRTAFEGLDREYVRGEVVERGMPTFEHGEIQGMLFLLFHPLVRTHGVYTSVGVRMRLAPNLYRIPDIAVFEGRPEQIPLNPPLAVIEILSADDRWSEVLAKLDEYREWGVPNIWLVDAERQALLVYRDRNIVTVPSFTLPGYPVEIRFADLIG